MNQNAFNRRDDDRHSVSQSSTSIKHRVVTKYIQKIPDVKGMHLFNNSANNSMHDSASNQMSQSLLITKDDQNKEQRQLSQTPKKIQMSRFPSFKNEDKINYVNVYTKNNFSDTKVLRRVEIDSLREENRRLIEENKRLKNLIEQDELVLVEKVEFKEIYGKKKNDLGGDEVEKLKERIFLDKKVITDLQMEVQVVRKENNNWQGQFKAQKELHLQEVKQLKKQIQDLELWLKQPILGFRYFVEQLNLGVTEKITVTEYVENTKREQNDLNLVAQQKMTIQRLEREKVLMGQQINDLKRRMDGLMMQGNQHLDQNDKKKRYIEQLLIEIERQNQKQQVMDEEMEEVKNKYNDLDQESKNLKIRLEQNSHEFHRVQEQNQIKEEVLGQKTNEIEQLQRDKQQLENFKEQFSIKIEDLENELQKFKLENEQIKQNQNKEFIKETHLKELIENKESERWKDVLESIKNELSHLKPEKSTDEQIILRLENQQKNRELKDMREKLKNLEDRNEKMREKIDKYQMSQRQPEIQQNNQKDQSQLNKLVSEKERLEILNEQSKEKMDKMRDNLKKKKKVMLVELQNFINSKNSFEKSVFRELTQNFR